MFSCFHGSSVFSRFGHGFWSRFEVVWASFWDLVDKNAIKKVLGKLLLFRKAKNREKGHARKSRSAGRGWIAPNRRIDPPLGRAAASRLRHSNGAQGTVADIYIYIHI